MEAHHFKHIAPEHLSEPLNVSRTDVQWEVPDSLEIVTLEEFARRMQVGETTVWKWIRNGHLKPGRHFIQIERVIRFHWCQTLLKRLHEDCCSVQETNDSAQHHPDDTAKDNGKKRKYGKNINFDI